MPYFSLPSHNAEKFEGRTNVVVVVVVVVVVCVWTRGYIEDDGVSSRWEWCWWWLMQQQQQQDHHEQQQQVIKTRICYIMIKNVAMEALNFKHSFAYDKFIN